jgi:hypothetical protein
MACRIQKRLLISSAVVGLLALLLWWCLRRHREEEVILRTQLGTISRVREKGKPAQMSTAGEYSSH